jgi:predicted RNA binding protein YcfA (HicA-like mRNA interferase family)
MAKLPRMSGRECARTLQKVGFRFIRQGKGDHMIYRRDEPLAQVSIPDHRELHAGTLRGIITDAGLTVDQFLALLRD